MRLPYVLLRIQLNRLYVWLVYGSDELKELDRRVEWHKRYQPRRKTPPR